MAPKSPHAIPGGLVWSFEAASEAVSREDEDTGEQRRICFRNYTNENLILCWIGTSSPTDLHHFYTLLPYRGRPPPPRGLRGRRWRRNAEVTITAQDHVETSVEGHAFLIIAADNVKAVQKSKSLEDHKGEIRLIGAYRAEPESEHSENDEEEDEEDETRLHLVEIMDNQGKGPWQAIRKNVGSWRQRQRKGGPTEAQTKDETISPNARDRYRLTARWVVVKNVDPLDTRTIKKYQAATLGQCRWPVQLETNWYGKDQKLKQALEADLDALVQCLPPHAVTLLRDTSPTPVWVNRTFQYGPKCFPIKATGMCFHPGADWLDKHCMHTEKCECVELYDIAGYVEDRALWGKGGLLLHEFSHAYHHKACEDGYDNAEIADCYQAAMDEGLYDSVRVKGTQGPEARAYACTNAMEYFAELSTAFLGGIPKRKSAKAEEFNKWYPFNRQQIREHDPRAYEMLKRIWQVDDSP